MITINKIGRLIYIARFKKNGYEKFSTSESFKNMSPMITDKEKNNKNIVGKYAPCKYVTNNKTATIAGE